MDTRAVGGRPQLVQRDFGSTILEGPSVDAFHARNRRAYRTTGRLAIEHLLAAEGQQEVSEPLRWA